MARMRVTLVLLVALAAGGGLAYGTYNYMQNVPVRTVSMPTRPVGVAGYVLPGTRVDVVATASASEHKEDITSKVVLTNVQVLAAGTKIEQDAEKGKPMPVSVVTLLVDPEQSERLTLASTEGKIQLALRNPLDLTSPTTPGVRPAG